MRLILTWIISAAAVAAAAYLVPGIRMEGGATDLMIVALVLGLINALVRPILRWMACGMIVLTLGLFLLVINAAMLMLAAWVARSVGVAFFVDDFVSALVGSVIISLVSFLLSMILPDRD